MSQKQKKVNRLSVDQKTEIVHLIESGEKQADLAVRYGVSAPAISYIYKNKAKIMAFSNVLKEQNGRGNNRVRTAGSENNRVEQGLFTWFSQKRSQGEPISGSLLQEKALKFNAAVGGPSNFKASNGWLSRFKLRHQIRQVSVQGEKLSADAPASIKFCEQIHKYVVDNNLNPDNIYNADEMGHAWKSLPRYTLAASTEKSAPGRKIVKDRVSVLTCANATGTHRLPLLVIGKSKKPRCFKNIKQTHVVYANQKKAWMDSIIFTEWYTTHFLPSIKQRKPMPGERFILLLDNAPTHPSAEKLNAIDESCHVMYMPPNVTSLIQPMDQGVIAALKKIYRGRLLRELIVMDSAQNSTVDKFVKSWTLLDCCRTIAKSWNELSENTLRNGWKKIFPDQSVYPEHHGEEILSLANSMPGGSNFSQSHIDQWMLEDNDLPTCYALSDNEILQRSSDVLEGISPIATGGEEQEEEDEDEDDDENNTSNDNTGEKPVPSLEVAISSLDSIRDWCESTWDTTPEQLEVLDCIRNMVINRIVENRRQ